MGKSLRVLLFRACKCLSCCTWCDSAANEGLEARGEAFHFPSVCVVSLVVSPSPAVSQARDVTLLSSTGGHQGKSHCHYTGLLGEGSELLTSVRTGRFSRSSTINLVVLKGKKSDFRRPNLSLALPFSKRRFSYPA